MVNASSCTAELWMHLGDVLGGLLRSQELQVKKKKCTLFECQCI